jgi:hypothetical protein
MFFYTAASKMNLKLNWCRSLPMGLNSFAHLETHLQIDDRDKIVASNTSTN